MQHLNPTEGDITHTTADLIPLIQQGHEPVYLTIKH